MEKKKTSNVAYGPAIAASRTKTEEGIEINVSDNATTYRKKI
jgi:hypothetical protein